MWRQQKRYSRDRGRADRKDLYQCQQCRGSRSDGNKGAVTVDSGPVTQDDTYTYLAVPAAAFYNANSKLRTKNSNIEKMPGGNTGAPIYQGAANAGWNQWSGSRGLSYTFTKDYPEVMVYASGGCSGYGMSSSEDQVKASMYCNLYPGAATVSCTGGIVIKKE